MVILFQGDSVTDACRSREDPTDLGPGYAAFTAQKIKEDMPGAFVPLDGMFAAACIGNDPHIFSDDGIHPNDGGIKLIAETIAPVIERFIK